ncbi:Uncharacterised protein [uncultured archaeon]|nr:Uncharacterised protein [uncultured archaeon]
MRQFTILILLLVLYLLTTSVSATSIIQQNWRIPLISGVDYITVQDAGNGEKEIIAVSGLRGARTTIYKITPSGEPIEDFLIPRFYSYAYPTEVHVLVRPAQIDGTTKYITASEAIGQATIAHNLYLAERTYSREKSAVTTEMAWAYRESGLTTDALVSSENGSSEIFTVSEDTFVRILSADGNLILNRTLGEPIWMIAKLPPKFNRTSEYVAGSSSHLFIINQSLDVVRKVPSPSRPRRLIAFNDTSGAQILALFADSAILYDTELEPKTVLPITQMQAAVASDINEDNETELVMSTDYDLLVLSTAGDVILNQTLPEKTVDLLTAETNNAKQIIVGTHDSIVAYTINVQPLYATKAELLSGKAEISAQKNMHQNSADQYSHAAELFLKAGMPTQAQEALTKADVQLKEKAAIQAVDAIKNALKSGDVDGARRLYYEALSNAGDTADIAPYVKDVRALEASINSAEKADAVYANASESYVASNYADALAKADEAIRLYVEVDNQVGINKARSLKSLVERRTSEENLAQSKPVSYSTTTIKPKQTQEAPATENNAIIAILLAVVLLAILLALLKLRYRSPPKRNDKTLKSPTETKPATSS